MNILVLLDKEEVFIWRPPIRVVYIIDVHGVILTEKCFVFTTLSFLFQKKEEGRATVGKFCHKCLVLTNGML